MTRKESVAIVSDIRSRYNCFDADEEPKYHALAVAIEALSDPQIIYCKDCVKWNKERGYYHNGEVVHKDDACPLIEFRGRAIGCEYDYGFCNFAERKEE